MLVFVLGFFRLVGVYIVSMQYRRGLADRRGTVGFLKSRKAHPALYISEGDGLTKRLPTSVVAAPQCLPSQEFATLTHFRAWFLTRSY